jgi:hypothetical protein
MKKGKLTEITKKTYKALHNTIVFPGMISAKNIIRPKQNIPHLLISDIDVPHKTVLHSKKIK